MATNNSPPITVPAIAPMEVPPLPTEVVVLEEDEELVDDVCEGLMVEDGD